MNSPAKRFERILKAPLVRRSAVNAHGTPEADDTAATMYSNRSVMEPKIEISAAIIIVSTQHVRFTSFVVRTHHDTQDIRNSRH